MRNCFLTLFLVVVCSTAFTQAVSQANIDSLRRLSLRHSGDTSEVDVLNALAEKFYLSDTDSTRYYAQKAAALARTLVYNRGLAYAFHNLGTFFLSSDNFDSAKVYLERSLAIKRACKDSVSISGTLNNLGGMYPGKGNYKEALRHYQESLKIKLLQRDSLKAGRTMHNIGRIYEELKKYDLSFRYYNQALEIKKTYGSAEEQASTLSNIGVLYINLEKYTEALGYLEQAYRIVDSLGVTCRVAFPAGNLGVVYEELGRPELAMTYLQKGYEAARACEIHDIICLSLVRMGIIHGKQGLTKRAEKELLESYEVASAYDLKARMHVSTQALYKFYKSKNNISAALAYLELNAETGDELFNEDLAGRLTSMELNFAFEQERDSLEYQKQVELLILNTQLEQQRLMKYLMTVGLSVAIIFVVLLYLFYRSKRKDNRDLLEKNNIISAALSEREILLREIHHRVKNNLQVVSSLLNIQSKYLTDELSKKAVLEGRDRVQSMALVHEKLYRSESLAHVDIGEYLEQLVRTLFRSYDITEDRVSLSVRIEPLNFSTDTTILLGLIINELISNALKHAFPEDRSGWLRLSLCRKGEEHELEVSDNGVGLDAPEALTKSYGYRIVQSITRGLNGRISVQNENGTSFRLTF